MVLSCVCVCKMIHVTLPSSDRQNRQYPAENSLKKILLVFPNQTISNDSLKTFKRTFKNIFIIRDYFFTNDQLTNKTFTFAPPPEKVQKKDDPRFSSRYGIITCWKGSSEVDKIFITFYITTLDNPFINTIAPFCQTTVFFLSSDHAPVSEEINLIDQYMKIGYKNSMLALFSTEKTTKIQLGYFPINLGDKKSIQLFISFLSLSSYFPHLLDSTKHFIYVQAQDKDDHYGRKSLVHHQYLQICLPSPDLPKSRLSLKLFNNCSLNYKIIQDPVGTYKDEMFLIYIQNSPSVH